ncbi:carboxymuconolactone decarboxylase family protein [Agromyces sp. MMS24-JH15]|uniref:carboxymuconolactone decarboxylase family protein n=1 Tax=Agromyces sp. MMS24-JH15 TaxID=3243765 RepID=UPI003748561C
MTSTEAPTRSDADSTQAAAAPAAPVASHALVASPRRLDIEGIAPAFIRAVTALDDAAEAEADRAEIAGGFRQLVRLRASQLNGCAYCVDLHAHDAREAGESPQRVDAITVWPESGFFTARERAALGLVDAVTRLSDSHVPADVYAEAAAHWSDEELSALLALITSVNAWNQLSVATRAWRPRLRG